MPNPRPRQLFGPTHGRVCHIHPRTVKPPHTVSRLRQNGEGMNGASDAVALNMAALADRSIPDAVRSLRDRQEYVSKVLEYIESTCTYGDKEEALKQAREYVVEILRVISKDMEVLGTEMNKYLSLQGLASETIGFQLNTVTNSLQLLRAHAAKVLADGVRSETESDSKRAIGAPKDLPLSEDVEFSPAVPERAVTVQERLLLIDDYDVTFK